MASDSANPMKVSSRLNVAEGISVCDGLEARISEAKIHQGAFIQILPESKGSMKKIRARKNEKLTSNGLRLAKTGATPMGSRADINRTTSLKILLNHSKGIHFAPPIFKISCLFILLMKKKKRKKHILILTWSVLPAY